MVMTRITKEKQQSLTFYGRGRESRRDAEKSLRGIGLTRGFPARDWVRDYVLSGVGEGRPHLPHSLCRQRLALDRSIAWGELEEE